MDALGSSLRSIGCVCFVLLSLTCCATNTRVHDYCAIAKPIFLQKGEAAGLSDSTARQILANNETWESVCAKH